MAGYQTNVSSLTAGGAPSQQSHMNHPNNSLPRRPAPQYPQQRTQSQHSATKTHSISSQSSSVQMSAARPTDTRSNSEIFGKTSGWHHGSKYDIEDFIRAAENRNKSDFKGCLKAGLNVNYCRWTKGDKFVGNGARSIADIVASRNDTAAMRLLIEYKVDLSGRTSAMFASSAAAQSRFGFLFTGDDRKAVEKDSWSTPLHLACKYGFVEMVRIILEEGRLDPNTRDCQLRVGLHMNSMGQGSLEVAQLLLKMGAVVDLEDHKGGRPLALAALYGKVELVKLLIDHGAYVDSVDTYGETAIFNAALQDQLTTISALAARGGDINIRNIVGISAFFKAASKFRSKTMDHLIECGADVDARDNNGSTALLRATMAKNVPLIAHLLQLGADIDAKDNDGWTPLFVAMLLKDEGLLRLILQSEPNLGETDNYYNVALSQAAILGATSVVRHIISLSHQNTSIYQQMNLVGETALTLACKYNNSPIVKLLLKHGDNPHQVDPNGYRALDRALYWGSYASARLILDSGTSIDTKSLFALQQGLHDNPKSTEDQHNMIINHLRSLHPNLAFPSAAASSPLRDLFAKPITTQSLVARMREKQGKPASDPEPSKDEKGDAVVVVSPDPFEACIPESPIMQIINNHTTTINAKGIGALEVGAAGANIALNVAGAVLGL